MIIFNGTLGSNQELRYTAVLEWMNVFKRILK